MEELRDVRRDVELSDLGTDIAVDLPDAIALAEQLLTPVRVIRKDSQLKPLAIFGAAATLADRVLARRVRQDVLRYVGPQLDDLDELAIRAHAAQPQSVLDELVAVFVGDLVAMPMPL